MSGKPTDLVLTNFYNPHLDGGGSLRNNPKLSLQVMAENMYLRNLTELACNRFEWQGLPDSVNPRFLELVLFETAVAVFYHDDIVGQDLVAKGAGSGMPNAFDDPTSFTIIGADFMAHDLDDKECVPIYANYLRVPDLDIVNYYTRRLADLDRSIEIAAKALRRPKIIKAKESTKLTWTNINRQIDEGVDVVFVGKNLDMSDIEILDIGTAPGALNELRLERNQTWNECMGMLGINNSNQDKKERLVADEVSANDEQVDATRNIALNARQYAASKINKMFGLNVSVDFKHKPAPEAPTKPAIKGGE